MKAAWAFDFLINMKSRDNLENLYSQYHKTYDQ